MRPISFRVRLLALVVLAILPALGLILYNSHEERSLARENATRNTVRLAQLQGSNTSEQVQTAFAIMTGLAQVPAITNGGPECSQILRSSLAQVAGFASISVAALDGSIRCSSSTAPLGQVVNSDSFLATIKSRTFERGLYHLDPVTGKAAADVSLALPGPPDQPPPGVLTMEFDIQQISASAMGFTDAPSHSVIFVTDRQGTLIIAVPESSAPIGSPIREPELLAHVAGQRGSTTFEARGADGIRRLYAIEPVGDGPSPYVVVGFPSAEIFAESNTALTRNLLALAIVAVIALAAAWAFGDLFFLRRVRALAAGTRAVAAGHLTVKVPGEGEDELGQLARSFNEMTAALAGSVSQVEAKEAELRALFAAMTDVIFVVNREGICLRVAQTGYPGALPEHLVGLALEEAFPPEDAAAFRQLIRDALDTGLTLHREYSVVDPEGQQRWFEPAISPMSDDTVVWVARDITERRETHARLEEREAQYRSIFESSSEGITIVGLDGVPVDVNPAMCAMHGYTREEFLALPPGAYIHPDYHPLRRRIFDGVTGGNIYRVRARDIRKDGTTFDVDVTGSAISYRGSPHVLAVVRDVTEQVQAERLLEERVEERTREIGTLLSVSRSIASTIDLVRLRTLVLDQLREAVGYAGCSILVKEGDSLVVLDFRGPEGTDAASVDGFAFSIGAVPEFRESLEQGRPVIIDDIQANTTGAEYYRRVVSGVHDAAFGYVRSWLGVPLVINDRVVGLISLSSDQPGFYTQRAANLALAIGTSTASAIENARLFAETEARTRELQTLLDVSRTVVSTLDLKPLLGQVLDQLRDVIPYAGSSIMRIEGDDMVIIESRGATRSEREPEAVGFRFPLATAGDLRDQLLANHPSITPDILGDDDHAVSVRNILGPSIESGPFRYIRSQIIVPLVARDRTLGAMSVSRSEVDAFTSDDIELTTAFASQAAIAIDNADLFERAEGRSRELATLLEVSRSVASTIELRPLLALVLDHLRQVIPYAGATILERQGERMIIVESRGPDPDYPDDGIRGLSWNMFDNLNSQGQPTIFTTSSISPDVWGDNPHGETFRRIIGSIVDLSRLAYMHSQIVVPLQGRDGFIGAMAVSRTEIDSFTQDDLELVEAFASQAAIAIENARLFQQREERVVETETLARIASSLTFEQPLEETLGVIAGEIVASTGAVAASLTLMVDGVFRGGGQRNLPPGFLEVAASAVANGAHSPAVEAARTLGTFAFDNARTRILGDRAWAPLHPLVQDAAWEGMVTVPLATRGKGVGSLDAYYREGEMPSPKERDFLRAIADQAAIAVENALLFDEARLRAQEQAAVASVAGSLTYDRPLPALLDELAGNVAAGTGAVASAVVLLNPESSDIESQGSFGLPEGYLARAIRGWVKGGLASRMPLRAGESIVIRNAREFLRENPAYADARGFTDLLEWDTFIIVPLAPREHIYGALLVYLREGDEPSPQRLAFLRALADQATVAVENARLFDQVRARTRQLQALYRADEELHRSLVLDDVLDALLDVVIQLLDSDYSSLITWERSSPRPRVVIRGGVEESVMRQIEESLMHDGRERTVGRYAPGGEFDVRVQEDIAAITDPSFPHDRNSKFGIGAIIEVPVVIEGELFAVLTASYTHKRIFREEERRAMLSLAHRAALAIENARLYEQAQSLAAVEERQRLARELHDSVSQALFGIALGARTARTLLDRDAERAKEPVDYVLSLAEAGLAEMRALIFELRPESLETEGLIAAIGKQVASTRARYGIEVDAEHVAGI